jgi:Zn-dependent peptidase ImmA (M78 family)
MPSRKPADPGARPKLIVFAAFQFDPEAAKDIDETNWPGVTCSRPDERRPADRRPQEEARQQRIFWLIGQPDVGWSIINGAREQRQVGVSVHGFDYYNTKTGGIESGGEDKIAVWLLDTDYDGRSLYPRQVFFPMAGAKEGWARLAKNLKAEIDEELDRSLPRHGIAALRAGRTPAHRVKIVDDRGIEKPERRLDPSCCAGRGSRMRDALGFEVDERRRIPTWTDALRRFIEQADRLGVLVMVSGVVGTNNRRKLDPKEFRGFALCDPLAPLVFINGSDSKAAQMFTLAHELAHVWLGQSALSNAEARTVPDNEVERWCNRVAAELLVPLAALREVHDPGVELPAELDRMACRFKVSTLVVLRRLRDLGRLAQAEYWDAYEAELSRLPKPRESGGDFYLTQAVRAGRRFSRALIVNTFEGQSSFTEAFRLLGVKKVETLRRFGTELEIPL